MRVSEVRKNYGKCLELVSMDPNFNNISVGLFIKKDIFFFILLGTVILISSLLKTSTFFLSPPQTFRVFKLVFAFAIIMFSY